MAGVLEMAADGVYLAVRATPKSRRPGVGGIVAGDALAVGVTAAPEDGKANDAVIALLADYFNLPRRAFSLTQGATSRRKRFKITGAPDNLRILIEAKLT